MRDGHFVVFGAEEKGTKGIIIGTQYGMRVLKICQLRTPREFGDADFQEKDLEGIYTSLYFANKSGKKSIKVLIEALRRLLENWEAEDVEE